MDTDNSMVTTGGRRMDGGGREHRGINRDRIDK